MATYYRWRKSRIGYDVDKLSTRDEIWLGNAILGETIPIYWSINKNSILASENGIKLSTSDQLSYTVQESRVPLDSIGMSYFSPFNVCIALTTSWQNAPGDGNIVNPEGKDAEIYYKQEGEKPGVYIAPYYSRQSYFVAKQIPGTFVDYVYSTSSSAYPNGGVSGEYYYDQRTTVTSPTAPTGLTYPNSITTPKVTVSWNAATSNTDYPVQKYRVYVGYNGTNPPIPTAGESTSTSFEFTIPTTYNGVPVTSVQFGVAAIDTNGQLSGITLGSVVPVYLAPTLTVPQMVMQGQQATISWTAIEGADSYTLQRKSSEDEDWTQVYSGADLSYTETVGAWTSLQYRVQTVFSDTPGGWATSGEIQIVSASALVISGSDGDLGTLVNDVSYTVSSSGSTELTVVETINGTETRTFTATNGATNKISVIDLPTGYGTIKITASTNPGSGVVSVTREWTYSKTAQTFPNSSSVAQLTQQGKIIWAKTIAEAVRTPGIWGGNLGLALSLLSNAALYNQEAKNMYEEVTVSLADKAEGQIIQLPEDGHMVEFYVAKINYEPELNGAGRLLLVRKGRHSNRQWNLTGALTWEGSSLLTWYNSTYKSLFPEEVQTAMGTTTYRFTKGDTGAVATRADSVFALSLTELGETGLVVNTEGSKLPISDMLQVMEGDAYGTQWTRSFDPEDDETSARYISATGAPGATLATSVQGARPVFTLPSTFSQTYFVDKGGNIGEQQEIIEAGSWSDIHGNAIPAVKIETGSYTGTGTYGQNNPTTLTFGFNVKLVIITGRWGSSSVVKDDFSLILNKEAGGYFGSLGSNMFNGKIAQSDEKTLKLYNTTSAANQMNANGVTYHYIGIGLSGGEST